MWAVGIRQSFKKGDQISVGHEEERLGKLEKTAGGKSDKQRQRGKSEDSQGTAEANTVGSFIKKNSEHDESRS